jgi:hypothetical protein
MFQLRVETPYGKVAIKIARELTIAEKLQLTQLAHNITSYDRTANDYENSATFVGPRRPQNDETNSALIRFTKGQTKLGEHPVDCIDMGDYEEPKCGMCIRMLHMPYLNGFPGLIGKLRQIVPISGSGWKNILFANYTGVKFETNVASKIMGVLKSRNIFAEVYAAPSNGGVVDVVLQTN